MTLEAPAEYNDADEPQLYYFDEKAAAKAVKVYERYLTHVKGDLAGKPFILPPWQKNLTRRLYGWKKKSDNLRRYRMAYIEVGAGSGKTTWAAGCGIIGLVCDGENAPEVYSAAGDKDQAAIVFGIASAMIEKKRELRERIKPYKRVFTSHGNLGIWRVLSKVAGTKFGLDASTIIFDELHCQPNAELWNALRSRTRSRPQPLIIAITTAGFDRESVCYKQHEYALAVADPGNPVSDDTFLGVILAAAPEDDWKDPKTWSKANPNMGITPKLEFLQSEFRRALAMPSEENNFRRQYLNQWTEQEFRWMNMDEWNACDFPVDYKRLKSRPCWGGLDLSESKDLTAFVLVWPPEGKDKLYSVLPWFWVPADRIEKRVKMDRVPYDHWRDQGFLRTCPGRAIDYMQIIQEIGLLSDLFDIRAIGFDRYGAKLVSQLLAEEGMNMIMWGQGYGSMSAPMKELERLVLTRELAHGNNPILNWNVRNLVAAQDPAGNIKPAKDKSKERIDGAAALIDALGVMLEQWAA